MTVGVTRFTIPAQPDYCDDLVLCAFIEQAAAAEKDRTDD